MKKFDCVYTEVYSVRRTIIAESAEDAKDVMYGIAQDWLDLKDWLDLVDAKVECEEIALSDFLDDEEKMIDFIKLSKDEFLDSYSYLTDEEYDLTLDKLMKKLKGELG